MTSEMMELLKNGYIQEALIRVSVINLMTDITVPMFCLSSWTLDKKVAGSGCHRIIQPPAPTPFVKKKKNCHHLRLGRPSKNFFFYFFLKNLS